MPKFFFQQYPASVYFILLSELCERFSFYGMKAVLWIYINEYLGFEADPATSIYHAFVFGAYFVPIIGGILSDAYLGKFKTIVYLSLVYCLGNIVMSVTAVPKVTGNPPHWWGMAIGLLLIAFGTGGIKPCVSAFGADQFREDQSDLISSFFAFFYLAINLGSVVSLFVTPILRVYVGYWAAFGLPAVLILIATIIFVLGNKKYKKIPPGENVIASFFRVIKSAIVLKWRNKRTPVSHWLDRAIPEFGEQKVADVKAVVAILIAFVPLPIFWSLFDQNGSRWVEQATMMEYKIGRWEITPDQIPTLNALFTIILTPTFDRGLYPFFRDCLGVDVRPLRRMKVGMVLTALSFFIAATLQLWVEKQKISILWMIPQYFVLSAGEVMVSVSGLEFSYSQAPSSMKSVLMSIWLLTVAFGNLLVAALAEIPFNLSSSFYFYGGLMILFLFIFMFLTRNYKYAEERPKIPEDKTSLLATPDENRG